MAHFIKMYQIHILIFVGFQLSPKMMYYRKILIKIFFIIISYKIKVILHINYFVRL